MKEVRRLRNQELAKKHYYKDRDASLAKNKRWREAHPDRVRELKREWAARHRETERARAAAWFRKTMQIDPERIRHHSRQHSALRRVQVGGNRISRKDWLVKLAQFEWRCAYCVQPFTLNRKATQDHVIPLSKGGTHTLANLVPACDSCNKRKNARSREDFLAELKSVAALPAARVEAR